ncbi:MAG: phosphoribosylglycinamide formyltransferase [Pyrinomonadaceae bacterium]|nr:phosphoribosylglycinamide formyltransferase [Phycisphaerales bacterium]
MSAAHTPRLAVFLSGSGRTLVNLAESIARGTPRARIALVVASKECLGAARARSLGLPVQVQEGDLPLATLDSLLRQHAIDWVVLAGYIRLLPIPPGYAGRIVNIHPALLPEFGGHGMYGKRVHEAVLAAGRSVSGCTVHLCDDQYDRGRIVLQRTCPVRPGDTPETLAARVFEQECLAYPEALELLLSGKSKEVGGLAS